MLFVQSCYPAGLTASQRHEFIHPYTSVHHLHTSVLHTHTSIHYPHTSTHLYTHLHTISKLLHTSAHHPHTSAHHPHTSAHHPHTSAHHPHTSAHSAHPVNNVIQRAMVVMVTFFFKFFFLSVYLHTSCFYLHPILLFKIANIYSNLQAGG